MNKVLYRSMLLLVFALVAPIGVPEGNAQARGTCLELVGRAIMEEPFAALAPELNQQYVYVARADQLPFMPTRAEGCARIDIAPASPSEEDMVRITCWGEWTDSCAPFYWSHQLADRIIRVSALAGAPCGWACLTVITPWQLSIEVGRLPRGSYQVHFYVVDMCTGAITLCATKSFEVSRTAKVWIYFPVLWKDQCCQ